MPQYTPKIKATVYERFCTLILERSGLHFGDKRRQNLERGLLRTFAQSDCQDLMAYYQLLLSCQTDHPEWERLISHLTIGETYFFRDRAQFQALQHHVLPEIIERKGPFVQQLRIWTAGCATGEEPYSIAILLRDFFPQLPPQNVSILATDINRKALTQARDGIYGPWSFREKEWEWIKRRYYSRQKDHWQLTPEIRNMVSFAYLNLADDTYPSAANNMQDFDLILCRNVIIYFDSTTTQHVVGQLCRALLQDGWLILGHSEPSPNDDQFAPRNFPGAVLYQKTADAAPPDLSWLTSLEQRSATPVFQTTSIIPTMQVVVEPAPKKTPAPTDLCQQAARLLEQGQSEKALAHINQAIDIDPDCAEAAYFMAKIEADTENWEQAKAWCKRALEQNSLLTQAYYLLGLIASQQGNPGEALAAMKRVVYLDRGAVLGHFWLANLYQELGEPGRARKSLENAARLLENLSAETLIPWSDGVMAGRLLLAVRRQMNELAQAIWRGDGEHFTKKSQ